MGYILFHNGERAFLDGLLAGQAAQDADSAYSPGSAAIIPDVATGAQWGVGLATSAISELEKSSDITAIEEIGTTTPAGYDRATLGRNSTDWPVATLVSGSYQSAAAQVEFTFSGAPSPNGANMWFLAGSDVVNADNALFGADLSAERTYVSGNTHQLDCVFRLS